MVVGTDRRRGLAEERRLEVSERRHRVGGDGVLKCLIAPPRFTLVIPSFGVAQRRDVHRRLRAVGVQPAEKRVEAAVLQHQVDDVFEVVLHVGE